jgi:hypothetical protein
VQEWPFPHWSLGLFSAWSKPQETRRTHAVLCFPPPCGTRWDEGCKQAHRLTCQVSWTRLPGSSPQNPAQQRHGSELVTVGKIPAATNVHCPPLTPSPACLTFRPQSLSGITHRAHRPGSAGTRHSDPVASASGRYQSL